MKRRNFLLLPFAPLIAKLLPKRGSSIIEVAAKCSVTPDEIAAALATLAKQYIKYSVDHQVVIMVRRKNENFSKSS